jgi:iron(III) transport system permease protein
VSTTSTSTAVRAGGLPRDGVTSGGARRRPQAPLGVGLLALLVAIASLSPVGYLVLREGFSFALLRRELDNPSTPQLVANTAVLVATVTGFAIALGVGLAVLVTRTDLPFRRAWIVLFTMPLAVPGFVSSYTWVAASFRYFPTSTALNGLGGSTLILGLGLFPYVFLPAVAALRLVDATQEEAARALGRSRWNVWWSVTLPQLRVAIAAGALIVMLHVLAEFGGLQLLNYDTLTTAVVRRVKTLGAPESARALAVVLVGGALVLLTVERLLRGRRIPTRLGRGVVRRPAAWRLGRAKPLWLLALLAIAFLALGVPAYICGVGLADGLGSHAHGDTVVAWAALGQSALTSTKLAVSAAVVATLVGLPISWLAARHPGPLATGTERAIWLAHALPGVILALALVFIGIHWFRPLYQTSAMLVAAYVILFLPLAVGSQSVGFRAAAKGFDDVSHSLGCGRFRTLARVTLPLAAPGVAAGALFVLLDSAKELTTTLLMQPTGTATLTTALWSTTNGEVLDFTAAAPYAIALIVLGVIPAYFLARRVLVNLRQQA